MIRMTRDDLNETATILRDALADASTDEATDAIYDVMNRLDNAIVGIDLGYELVDLCARVACPSAFQHDDAVSV